MLYRKSLSREQALQKAKHYCSYQERCHAEVKEKLYSFRLRKTDTEALLSQLIEEGYLNEERFAIQFAGGKFRMKQWGRIKIKYELKQKQVSEYCIKKALKQIGDEEYIRIIHKLANQKWQSLKGEKNLFIKLRKTQDYLLQKGFEPGLAGEVLKEIQKNPE
ncbi:MAG: regulatory protein RecX [Chitinophagaceae bacterium]|nr:regulatory protein RecX [Chitinophagaceae bacterium]